VIDGSQDGVGWTAIDRITDSKDLNEDPFMASFAVANSTECRFIRLTQTDKNHSESDHLVIRAFEFFGILLA
jgi:hypothetical protein